MNVSVHKIEAFLRFSPISADLDFSGSQNFLRRQMRGLQYNTPARFRYRSWDGPSYLSSTLPKAACFAAVLIVVATTILAPPFDLSTFNLFGSDRKIPLGWRRPMPLVVPGKVSRAELEPAVRSASREFKVKEELIWAVITVESNFNAKAKSRVGAMGLMQLMPDTASDLNVKDPFDPSQNIRGGARYLSSLLGEFNGDWRKALAAYNSGPAVVRKHNGIPPYPETRQYVAKVMSAYQMERAKTYPKLSYIM